MEQSKQPHQPNSLVPVAKAAAKVLRSAITRRSAGSAGLAEASVPPQLTPEECAALQDVIQAAQTAYFQGGCAVAIANPPIAPDADVE